MLFAERNKCFDFLLQLQLVQCVIHLSLGGLWKKTELPVMWALNFTELWYCYSAMIQGTISIDEITFPWRCSRAFPRALSLQPRIHACGLVPHAACPGPGVRNWPRPSQPDFIWSIEKNFILFSGVQSCLLDEKGRPRLQQWFLFMWFWVILPRCMAGLAEAGSPVEAGCGEWALGHAQLTGFI